LLLENTERSLGFAGFDQGYLAFGVFFLHDVKYFNLSTIRLADTFKRLALPRLTEGIALARGVVNHHIARYKERALRCEDLLTNVQEVLVILLTRGHGFKEDPVLHLGDLGLVDLGLFLAAAHEVGLVD
jgi:hypothetical protein